VIPLQISLKKNQIASPKILKKTTKTLARLKFLEKRKAELL